MKTPRLSRFKTLFDFSAWLLMLPAAIILYRIDPAMLMTVGQWLLVAPILAGITIIVTRLVFPSLSIGWMVSQVAEGNRAAGTLAAALVLFVGLVFLALVLWARA